MYTTSTCTRGMPLLPLLDKGVGLLVLDLCRGECVAIEDGEVDMEEGHVSSSSPILWLL